MKKRELINYLKDNHTFTYGKTPFQYQTVIDGVTYNILFIKANEHKQITINSPKVIEVANGRLNGVRYQKRGSIFYRWTDKETPVLFCLQGSPYRILKYINENEVVDISGEKKIHNIHIIQSLNDFQSIQK